MVAVPLPIERQTKLLRVIPAHTRDRQTSPFGIAPDRFILRLRHQIFSQFKGPRNSEQKKIGPGLKGLSKRGTFSVNGNKITDESLKAWIENGDQLMPPFKDVLEAGQINDVIAYVKTL
jgi:hypothetical protein